MYGGSIALTVKSTNNVLRDRQPSQMVAQAPVIYANSHDHSKAEFIYLNLSAVTAG